MAEPEPVVRILPTRRAFVGWYALGALVLLAAIWAAAGGVLPPGWGTGVVLTGLGAAAVAVLAVELARWYERYYVEERQVILCRGLIARRTDTVQLFRVRDPFVRESVLGRILGYGDVHLLSTDRTHPELVLAGVRRPHQLHARLLAAVDKTRAQRLTLFPEDVLETGPEGAGRD